LNDGSLDAATSLLLTEQLAALSNPAIDERDATKRWRTVSSLVPALWEQSGAKDIAFSLMTAYMKKELGL
jgi:hypothetical protein